MHQRPEEEVPTATNGGLQTALSRLHTKGTQLVLVTSVDYPDLWEAHGELGDRSQGVKRRVACIPTRNVYPRCKTPGQTSRLETKMTLTVHTRALHLAASFVSLTPNRRFTLARSQSGTVDTALSAGEPRGSARALRSVQLIADC
jgi:hypothetical protein